MAETIPQPARRLLKQPAFAHLGTLMKDGTPQVTPVWVDVDDGHVVVNSAEGRVKVNNLRRDPRASVEVQDPDNPYAYVSIRGRAELTHEGADEHIDDLAKRYLGQDTYPYRQPGEVRVKIEIDPERVQTYGLEE